jgi:TatD DNase family protein
LHDLNPEFIDIGANLTHESFAADREAVMSRALEAGVRRLVVTGADLASSQQAHELTLAHPARLRCTAGVHPHHAQDYVPADRQGLRRLLAFDSVVAVGECGLDYFRDFSPREAQRKAFVAQLTIAVEVGKPVFLHQRDAHADFAGILREFRGQLTGGVAHCFADGRAELEDYLELGLYIGVTGWVCDERRGAALREAVPGIPADRLLIETDAPYLLPRDMPSKPPSRRNEPSYLPHIAQAVADLRGVGLASIAEDTTRNAEQLFGLKVRE